MVSTPKKFLMLYHLPVVRRIETLWASSKRWLGASSYFEHPAEFRRGVSMLLGFIPFRLIRIAWPR